MKNWYKLWDRHMSVGCMCDKGYFGGDCSQKMCDYGIDPLYFDDSSTTKWSAFHIAIMTTAPTIDMISDKATKGPASWALVYYDIFEEDWVTESFPLGASCNSIIMALQNLPNNAVPANALSCYRVEVLAKSPLQGVIYGDWNITWQTTYKMFSLSNNPRIYGSRTQYDILRPTPWGAGYVNSYDVPSPSDTFILYGC